MEQNKDQSGGAVRGEAVADADEVTREIMRHFVSNVSGMELREAIKATVLRVMASARAADAPSEPTFVWIAGSKTFSQVFGSEEAARKFVPHLPPSVSGGISITKSVVIGKSRAADAPSEPSELATQAMYGMHWPEGYVVDLNGKITPPKGRVNDFNFGYDNGYADGLQSIKDTVANIGAQAVAKSRAADTPSELSELDGWNKAANALSERAAGHFRNKDYDLQDECLQCAAMLHDLKPARPTAVKSRAADAPSEPSGLTFDQWLDRKDENGWTDRESIYASMPAVRKGWNAAMNFGKSRAADALDSQPTYTAPGVPEGFLLVPIIPTQEILDAIEDAAKAETSVEWDSNLGSNVYFGDASCVYNAILAVKPKVQIASLQPTDGGVRNG